jgi:hypothetical protein
MNRSGIERRDELSENAGMGRNAELHPVKLTPDDHEIYLGIGNEELVRMEKAGAI